MRLSQHPPHQLMTKTTIPSCKPVLFFCSPLCPLRCYPQTRPAVRAEKPWYGSCWRTRTQRRKRPHSDSRPLGHCSSLHVRATATTQSVNKMCSPRSHACEQTSPRIRAESIHAEFASHSRCVVGGAGHATPFPFQIPYVRSGKPRSVPATASLIARTTSCHTSTVRRLNIRGVTAQADGFSLADMLHKLIHYQKHIDNLERMVMATCFHE